MQEVTGSIPVSPTIIWKERIFTYLRKVCDYSLPEVVFFIFMANVKIKFPDNSVKEFESPVTPAQIAQGISRSLAQKALAASVNGRVVDLVFSHLLRQRCSHTDLR